jgi:dUTP pyrophosphatase
VGYDLYSVEDWTLHNGERHLFDTGVAAAVPLGYYGRIAPRSGLALKQGINVLAGVLDPDWRGSIGVLLLNTGRDLGDWTRIKAGTRIAQLIIESCITPEAEWSDELPDTVRGASGWGSSGE